MSNSNNVATEFWTQYAQGLYEVPRAWAHKGEILVHAFEAIAAASVDGSWHLNMRDQALMLAGMSIEIQLKAIIVNEPPLRSIVTATPKPRDSTNLKIWKVFYSHNLVELAKLADVSLSEEQNNVAMALTQYIYWRGRYVVPTARGIDDLIPIQLPNGLVGEHRGTTIARARDLIEHVIRAVKTRLYGE